MESEIRDVFRHCIRFPVPVSTSVVSDDPVDTAGEKRCITVLTRESNASNAEDLQCSICKCITVLITNSLSVFRLESV